MSGRDADTSPRLGDSDGLPDRGWLDSLGLPLGDWSLTPDVLLTLCREVVALRSSQLVELGSGASTAALSVLGRDFGWPERIVSFDQSDDWLEQTRATLPEGGREVVLVHAPLGEADGAGLRWYDRRTVLDAAPRRIDLLLVDGPVGSPGWPVREPALATLAPRLGPRSKVLLDDCQRPEEAAILARWSGPGGPIAGWTVERLDGGRAALLSRPGDRGGR